MYLFAGTVAPLSEIIVGAVLERRSKLCFYVPVVFVAFILDVFICTNALFDILLSKFFRKKLNLGKTIHKGSS
jgi:hypothetical protein